MLYFLRLKIYGMIGQRPFQKLQKKFKLTMQNLKTLKHNWMNLMTPHGMTELQKWKLRFKNFKSISRNLKKQTKNLKSSVRINLMLNGAVKYNKRFRLKEAAIILLKVI